MQSLKLAAFVFLSLSLVLTACGGQPTPAAATAPAVQPTTAPTEAGQALSIVDGTGQTLTFDAPPQRIICLYSRCMETLAALGVEPLAIAPWSFMVALAENPQYFEQPNEIVVLKDAGGDVDLEEIAALEPDLVLGWEEIRTGLDGIAPVYVVSDEMDSYQESLEEIREFAALLGREAQAEASIAAFEDRLAAYQQLAPKDRSVMYVGGTQNEIYVRDGESGTCNLFKEVAECAWPDPENAATWSFVTSMEGLLEFNPDVILLESWDADYPDTEALLAVLAENPLWQELAAYQNDRIFPVVSDAKDLDGMGTIGGSRLLDNYLPLIYPEVFPEPLTEAQVQEL